MRRVSSHVPTLAGLLVAALALAMAPAPAVPQDEDAIEWRFLAEYTLKKNRGEQKFLVGWERSRGIRALRLEVEGTPVEILSVEVVYAKGKAAEWKPETVVADQHVSQEFELDPALGYVVKLYLRYRLQPEEQSDRYDRRIRSDVTLVGRH